jgi:hypothetical protein
MEAFFSHVFATSQALQSFAIIVASATVVGLLGGKFPLFSCSRAFVTVLKAIPVMSIIFLAFIWFSAETVPLLCFPDGFPVMYVQIEGGVKQMDKSLDEMCGSTIYEAGTSLCTTPFLLFSPSLSSGRVHRCQWFGRWSSQLKFLLFPVMGVWGQDAAFPGTAGDRPSALLDVDGNSADCRI